jgi:O-antigen ligase
MSRIASSLCFCWGATLPLVFVARETAVNHVDATRVTIADVVSVPLGLLLLLMQPRPALPQSTQFLVACASFIAATSWLASLAQYASIPIPLEVSRVAAESAILVYLVLLSATLGLALGKPRTAVALLYGILVGLLGETLVVFIDAGTAALGYGPYFVDPTSNAMRGTFRRYGQLGQYGLGIAGFLFVAPTLPVFHSLLHRSLIRGAAVLALSLVALSTARTPSASVGVGLVVLLFLALTLKRWRANYPSVMALVFLGVALSANPEFSTHLVSRWELGLMQLMDTDGFFASQLQQALNCWLGSPWIGVGWGGVYSPENGRPNEIHNQYLAALASAGILGFLPLGFVFLRLGWRALRQASSPTRNGLHHASLACLPVMAAYAVDSLHAVTLRDRTFWLNVAVWVIATQTNPLAPVPRSSERTTSARK